MKVTLSCLLLIALVAGSANGGGLLTGVLKLFDWNKKEANPCSCSGWLKNPCTGVKGTKIQGCPDSNSYLQCKDSVCSIEPCPDGTLWNRDQNACVPCAAGMHVSATKKSCVCNTGKTYDGSTKSCVDCPTDSTKEADRCYCPNTKIYDKDTNTCKDCPPGSSVNQQTRQCQCDPAADGAPRFYSETDGTCKDCPGVWAPSTTWKRGSVCTCSGPNQVFDKRSVTCFECPSGSTAWNSACACQNRFKKFLLETMTCECMDGYVADAAGCVKQVNAT